MILRLLARFVVWLVVAGLGWMLVRAIGGAARVGRPDRPRPSAGGEGAAQRMVRDRECNTFLPRSKALTAGDGAEERYFCSEHCRTAWLGRQSTSPASRTAAG